MKTVRLLKDHQHTATRLWKKGDTPTVSAALAAELIGKGVAEMTDISQPLKIKPDSPAAENARGIDDAEWEEIMEKANKKRNAAPPKKGKK